MDNIALSGLRRARDYNASAAAAAAGVTAYLRRIKFVVTASVIEATDV